MENGYNFWVGNYSGVSRTGKVIPSGKMTKVSVIYNANVKIFCGSKTIHREISNHNKIKIYDFKSDAFE